MSLLRKGLKKLVTTIAVVSILASSVGFNNTMIYANTSKAIEQTLTDKSYTVQNEIEYIKDGQVTTNGYDKLRSMLSTDTVIEVKDNKIYMTLEFAKPEKGDQYSMIDNITITVDGKANKLTKNADENNRKYTVEIGSLSSDIQLSYDVNATMGSFVYNKNFLMNVKLEDVSLDRTCTLQNDIEYIKDGQVTTDGYDKLRSMLSTDTVIEVKDNKIYMTLEFAKPEKGDQYSMIDNITITVDGKANKLTKNADENNRKYTVEIGSLTSDIQLSYDVNATMGSFVYNKNFLMNVKLLGVPQDENNGSDDTQEEENNGSNGQEENDAVSGATTTVPHEPSGDVAENKLADGKYTIKNKTAYSSNSETGNSMVRSSLKEVSYIEVKNGEVYLTLEFADGMYEQMQNIQITVDGESTTPSINGKKYTFKVKSIDSDIVISASILAMNGMKVSYSVTLDETTVEKSSTSTNSSTSSSTSSTTNNSTSSSTSTNSSTTTETVAKKGKLYTIQNTVDYENQTGKDMARMYLNSTSKVELIDGQYYVTLTFTGAQYMKNHAIYVNGSKVSHSVTSKSDDAISLRFKVSKLSDTIGVGMYVAPMSRDIKFTVKLLENTLKFVKEYEVSSQVESVSTEEEAIEEIEETTTEEEVTENTVDTQTEVEAATATSNSTKGAVLYTTIGIALGSALTVAIGAIRKRKMQ